MSRVDEQRDGTGRRPERSGEVTIGRSLAAAAILLTAAASLRFLAPEYIDRDLARRIMGTMTGSIIVFYANVIPKVLPPLARLRCAPAAEQAVRRFAGWCLLLGGLAYMAAWMLAPIGVANRVAGGLLGSALLLVIGRHAWGRSRQRT